MKFELFCVFVCLVVTNILLSDTGALRLRFRRRRRNCKRLARPIQCRLPRPAVVASEPLELIPERRRIVGECFADVNRCPSGACVASDRTIYYCFWFQARKMTCPVYGVVNEVKVTETVDCGVFGSRDIDRVTSCQCGDDIGIQVVVKTFDSESGNILSGVSVTVNQQSAQEQVDGEYHGNISLLDKTAIVEANKDGYIRTVKRVDIPVGFTGPLHIDASMVKIADPVEIDSSVGGQLSISESLGVFVTFSSNSFKDSDGNVYNGPVKVSINYFGIDNDLINEVSGQFLYINIVEGKFIQLGTAGLFAITTTGPDGNLLSTGSVEITVPSGVKLWSQTPQGFWTPIHRSLSNIPTAGRKKRQNDVDNIITEIPNAQWTNLDIIYDQPNCYFKARVFETDGVSEIQTSGTTAFAPAVQAVLVFNTPPSYLVSIPTSSTQTPASTCYAVKCPLPGAGELTGLINMTSYEIVNVGGSNIPLVTSLVPKALSSYPTTKQTALNTVLFGVSQNNIDIFARFNNDINGPFYNDKSTCTNSGIDDAAFHFIKPEVPSYEPLPDGVDLCTARVEIIVEPLAIDVLQQQANSNQITITAVSILEINGVNATYTDVTFINVAPETPEGRFSVCLGYPCSLDNSATTVYITITSPNITVPDDLFDDQSGSSESESSDPDNSSPSDDDNTTVPALSCFSGNCFGPLCSAQLPFATFAGSFDAPFDVNDGPDFFSAMENGCSLISAVEDLASASSVFCALNTGKDRGPGEVPGPL